MPSVNDRIRAKAAALRLPTTAAFEISPICNFSCKMCYVRRTPEEVRRLHSEQIGVDEWLRIAREAREEGLLYLLITGGEPFLYPDFKRLYIELNRMGFLLSINTNASLIDESVIEWLRLNPPLRLNITLYGASDESYAELCSAPNGFTRVNRAVELLKAAGIRFAFNASITPQNRHELKQIVEYGRSKNGVPVRVATYIFPPVRRDSDSFGVNERLSAHECGIAEVLADFYQYEPEQFIKRTMRYSKFVPLSQIDFDNLPATNTGNMKCFAGRCSFWVDWQGRLSACGMYTNPAYSLRELTFSEAWRRTVESVDETICRNFCENCPNSSLCRTCISMIYNETGDINARPVYFCEMMQSASDFSRQLREKLAGEGFKPADDAAAEEEYTDGKECDF